MPVTRRYAVLVVLSLLLLSLQREAHVHPITHLGVPSKDVVASTSSAAADCLECALLAGGFNGVASTSPPEVADAPPVSVVFFSHRSRDADAPAWFQSRAPPAVLL